MSKENMNSQMSVTGIQLPETDLPYTSDIIISEIIINYNAIPNRMTIENSIKILNNNGMTVGQFIEILCRDNPI